ncbi:MAG: hypothetical protein ACREXU_10385 [Gammaproteobacteria bacterium]
MEGGSEAWVAQGLPFDLLRLAGGRLTETGEEGDRPSEWPFSAWVLPRSGAAGCFAL